MMDDLFYGWIGGWMINIDLIPSLLTQLSNIDLVDTITTTRK